MLSASCCRQRGMIYIYQFITSHVSTTLTVVWESGHWQHFKSFSLHATQCNGGLSNQFIYLIIGPLLNNKLIIYRGHEIEFSQFYVQNFKAVPACVRNFKMINPVKSSLPLAIVLVTKIQYDVDSLKWRHKKSWRREDVSQLELYPHMSDADSSLITS